MRSSLLVALAALPAACVVSLGVASSACGGPSFEGTTSDAGTPSPAGPSDAGSYCAAEAGTHTFCDDFDGLPLTSKWDSVERGTNGTAATDPTVKDSPPASFESDAPASLVTETRGRVVKSFGMASRIVVTFELAVDQAPVKLASGALGGDSLVGIYIGPSYSIGLRAHTDEVGYFEEITSDAGTSQVLTTKDLVATPTLTGWTTVALAIDLANASLSISIGGVQFLAEVPITPPSKQSVTLYLGAFSRNQAQSLAAHYDNVTVDTIP